MNGGLQNYLRDVLREPVERARDAKTMAKAAGPSSSSSEVAFAHGRAMAYYEVVSYLINQVDAFGIERESLGVDAKLDVDRDLL